MPDVVGVAVTLAISDFAKPDLGVEGTTGFVQGEDLGLQRPVTFGFRSGDERIEQGCADTLTVCCRCDVDADLSDAGGASGIRRRRERRPAEDGAGVIAGDRSTKLQVTGMPVRPFGWRLQEGGQARCETFAVDGADLAPVLALHGIDGKVHSACLSQVFGNPI